MEIPAAPGRKGLYKLGEAIVLIAVVNARAEIAINYLPGVAGLEQRTVTVVDRFALFQSHWFIGVCTLGFLNIVAAALSAPTILAIYIAAELMMLVPGLTVLWAERRCQVSSGSLLNNRVS